MITIFWWESLEEVKRWENRGVGKIIILKWIIKKLFGTAWTVFNRLRIGKSSSSLVFSPKAGFGRNQSPVRRPVWL